MRHGRPFCHSQRRAAWVEAKREPTHYLQAPRIVAP